MEVNSIKQHILCVCADTLDLPHSHLPAYVNRTTDGVVFTTPILRDVIIINLN
jgi:hypothetical protein